MASTVARRTIFGDCGCQDSATVYLIMVQINIDTSKDDLATLLDTARNASDFLKALSHETRLLILCLLSEGEKSVSELEEIMNMPQAAVSQQLARLRFDQLVATRRDGRMVYYSLADEEVSQLIGMLYEFFCKPARDKLA